MLKPFLALLSSTLVSHAQIQMTCNSAVLSERGNYGTSANPMDVCISKTNNNGDIQYSLMGICNADDTGVLRVYEDTSDCSGSYTVQDLCYGSPYSDCVSTIYCGLGPCTYIDIKQWFGVTQCDGNEPAPNSYVNYTNGAVIYDPSLCTKEASGSSAFSCVNGVASHIWFYQSSLCIGSNMVLGSVESECDVSSGSASLVSCAVNATEIKRNGSESIGDYIESEGSYGTYNSTTSTTKSNVRQSSSSKASTASIHYNLSIDLSSVNCDDFASECMDPNKIERQIVAALKWWDVRDIDVSIIIKSVGVAYAIISFIIITESEQTLDTDTARSMIEEEMMEDINSEYANTDKKTLIIVLVVSGTYIIIMAGTICGWWVKKRKRKESELHQLHQQVRQQPTESDINADIVQPIEHIVKKSEEEEEKEEKVRRTSTMDSLYVKYEDNDTIDTNTISKGNEQPGEQAHYETMVRVGTNVLDEGVVNVETGNNYNS